MTTADSGSAPWSCPQCGTRNDARATCVRCGVARWWTEDPPVDVPPAPVWYQQPTTYLALLYAALAALGVSWAVDGGAGGWWAHPALLWTEVGLAAGASVGALNHAAWNRRLHDVRLDLPETVRAAAPFEVTASLIPHRSLRGAHVSLSLHDRYFEARRHGRRRRVWRRQQRLASHRHLRGGTLRGRRQQAFTSAFEAPFPLRAHADPQAEWNALALSLLAPLWPPAGRAARNLREHGGYVVRLTLRHGPWRTTREVKVLVLHVGATLHVG